MFDESKIKDICEMQKTIMSCFKTQCYDINAMDSEEAGKAADIIKDLSETEKNMREAEYYRLVAEAMEEVPEEHYGRMGYNPNRGVNGRYKHGYRPDDQEHYVHDYLDNPNEFKRNMRMGYPEYGMAYDDYKVAKRNYTETHSETDKKLMERHAEEHFDNAIMTIKEIWKDLDPSQKAKMKNELTSLVGTM